MTVGASKAKHLLSRMALPQAMTMDDAPNTLPPDLTDDLLDVAGFARLVGFGKALARHRIETEGLASGSRDGEPLVTRAKAEAFKIRYDEMQAALAEISADGMDRGEGGHGNRPGPVSP